MAGRREMMTGWVVEALHLMGGKGKILDICKKVWELHESDIRNNGDLLFEWQYEIRWAGDILRRQGVLQHADSDSRGVWELT